MAVAQHPAETNDGTTTVETFGHFLARECQVILEVIITLSIVATVLMMMFFFFLAIIPATVGLLTYGLLMLANTIERKTAHEDEVQSGGGTVMRTAATRVVGDEVIHDDQSLADGTHAHQVEVAVHRRLTRVGIEILIGAGVIAVILASSVLDWTVLTLGVFILFCYIVLVTAPVWLAWLEKDMEEEVAHQRDLQ